MSKTLWQEKFLVIPYCSRHSDSRAGETNLAPKTSPFFLSGECFLSEKELW